VWYGGIAGPDRKDEEIPILFANPRKDKSALSRNSWIRWPKEISIMFWLNQDRSSGKPIVLIDLEARFLSVVLISGCVLD
jgi:hypothetical protein